MSDSPQLNVSSLANEHSQALARSDQQSGENSPLRTITEEDGSSLPLSLHGAHSVPPRDSAYGMLLPSQIIPASQSDSLPPVELLFPGALCIPGSPVDESSSSQQHTSTPTNIRRDATASSPIRIPGARASLQSKVASALRASRHTSPMAGNQGATSDAHPRSSSSAASPGASSSIQPLKSEAADAAPHGSVSGSPPPGSSVRSVEAALSAGVQRTSANCNDLVMLTGRSGEASLYDQLAPQMLALEPSEPFHHGSVDAMQIPLEPYAHAACSPRLPPPPFVPAAEPRSVGAHAAARSAPEPSTSAECSLPRTPHHGRGRKQSRRKLPKFNLLRGSSTASNASPGSPGAPPLHAKLIAI